MFKKQIKWTDAGQKFVHPTIKGDVSLKITINAEVFDACRRPKWKEHWFPLF